MAKCRDAALGAVDSYTRCVRNVYAAQLRGAPRRMNVSRESEPGMFTILRAASTLGLDPDDLVDRCARQVAEPRKLSRRFTRRFRLHLFEGRAYECVCNGSAQTAQTCERILTARPLIHSSGTRLAVMCSRE